MRKGFLTSLAALFASGSLAFGQGYYGYYPPPPMPAYPYQPYSVPAPPYYYTGPHSPAYAPVPQRPVVYGYPPNPEQMPYPQYPMYPPHPTRATILPPPPPPANLRASAIPNSAKGGVVPVSAPSRGLSEASKAAVGWSPLWWKKDQKPDAAKPPLPTEPCDTCKPSYPAQGLDPQPGTPILSSDGVCADGSCNKVPGPAKIGHPGTCSTGSCNTGSCSTGSCPPNVCNTGVCPTGPCDPCTSCPPPPLEHKYPCKPPRGYCGYGNVEVLYWFMQNTESPVLFTYPGRTGEPTQRLAAQDVDHGERVGVRALAGFWLSQELCLGFEVGGFYLFEHRADTTVAATPLSRPINEIGVGNTLAVVNDGVNTTGDALVALRTRLYGGEANIRWQVFHFGCGHFDLIGGFRYMHLEDDLSIQTQSTIVATGDSSTILDRFRTRNEFFGGQIGGNLEASWGRVFVNLYGKVALGNNRQSVNISGSTTNIVGGVDAVTPSGFLARESNIGSYERDVLCLIPEAGVTLGLKLTNHLRIYGGYSVIVMLDAVRPGEQIDTVINPVQGVPGTPQRPAFSFNEGLFWVQGGHAGIEFRY